MMQNRYFAQIKDGKVSRVGVLDQGQDMPNGAVETFRNPEKGYYAGIGMSYDGENFLPEKPYPSWVVDEVTKRWTAPTSKPEDGFRYYWDEPTLSWKQNNS